ncbi:hypothetical protein TWF696_004062 [Orbilia brochopaga]|uniref:Exonuclease V n=1 Tax=Orbilia brochopaga TaxID=3140254 RepID=A0AAV9V688_9PEZI
MSTGSPARTRPSLVFRPFDVNARVSLPPAKSPHGNTAPPPQPTTTGENSSSSQKSVASDEYGINFELDDDDAEAIEQVFAEYTRTLNEKLQRTVPAAPSSSQELRQTASQRQPEEAPAEQEEYHDSLALDSLLDLEYDDAELLAALVSQELPSSQSKAGKQSGERWMGSQENWDDEEVDRQVLLEYERWAKRTGYDQSGGEDQDIVDDTPETKELQRKEEESKEAYHAALEAGEPPPIEQAVEDTRSPLDRFRRRGGNTKLSVSDLLSNMWCEQQYHYTLLRGFKRRTAEMQAGTKIHREVEEEVHTVVPVTVKTKHDKWGLRIWNMIQGMESLRTSGLTRELEVWGWIDGVFINGVIDEVSFNKYEREGEQKEDFPEKVEDKAEQKEVSAEGNVTEALVTAAAPMEEAVGEVLKTPKKRGRPKKNPNPVPHEATTPQKQTSILDFITPSPKKTRTKGRIAYVLDLKTRSSYRIPEPGSSQAKSVHFQLMLYRLLLNDMIKATPKSMLKKLCKYHDIEASAPFSDELLAELASIADEDADGNDEVDLILENNSIEKLYTLYHKKLKQTISAVSPELAVVYRWQKNGEFLDSAEYMADDEMLKEHVDSVIAWWKGQRETVGVGIEEAWKCRPCEFAENCTWRLEKIQEAMEKFRGRRRTAME